MNFTHFINVDLARVYNSSKKKDAKLIATLAWGDAIEVVKQTAGYLEIRLRRDSKSVAGFLVGPSAILQRVVAPLDSNPVLKVDFVDVQQGDGAVIETPGGKLVLVDGGDNQMFARYLAGRFGGTTAKHPKEVSCIVVTHGDADHFSGLIEIHKTEKDRDLDEWKRIFLAPERIYHNGLVKRPSKKGKKDRKETEMFGGTKEINGSLYVTELVDDLTGVDSGAMNKFFVQWKKAISAYKKRNPNLVIQRLDRDSPGNPFGFLDNGIRVELLGPLVYSDNGKPALKFLRTPPKQEGTSQHGLGSSGSYSASHTVNGHSIVFKLVYGAVRFLFSGDLNEEAEDYLVKENSNNPGVLMSEVFKVPHHGSADFSNPFIAAVNPVVSVVSSGDESAAKEYIHPRATLMGALGRHSRIDRPLIFVTELVAFFKKEGEAIVETKEGPRKIFSFSRSAYGIVKMRTDGKRLLVYTNTGKDDRKEAYAYNFTDPTHPTRDEVVIV